MTGWTTSAVLIAPAAYLDAANALAQAMGWSTPGWPAYSVPLSPTGAEPATHWGLRTGASPTFAAMIEAARLGELPEELAGDFQPQAVAALIGALTISIEADEADPAEHFARVVDAAGLVAIEYALDRG